MIHGRQRPTVPEVFQRRRIKIKNKIKKYTKIIKILRVLNKQKGTRFWANCQEKKEEKNIFSYGEPQSVKNQRERERKRWKQNNPKIVVIFLSKKHSQYCASSNSHLFANYRFNARQWVARARFHVMASKATLPNTDMQICMSLCIITTRRYMRDARRRLRSLQSEHRFAQNQTRAPPQIKSN